MTGKQRLKEIGSRLTTLREQLDYSRDQMAVHCEVTESAYAKNERGDHLPKLDTLENLVKKFDASMDWLLFNRGPLLYKEKTGPEKQQLPEEKPPVQQKPTEKQTDEKCSINNRSLYRNWKRIGTYTCRKRRRFSACSQKQR